MYKNRERGGVGGYIKILKEVINAIGHKKLRSTDVSVKFICFIHLFLFLFYRYIYPPDSQESDGGANTYGKQNPHLLPEMPRYCYPLVI